MYTDSMHNNHACWLTPNGVVKRQSRVLPGTAALSLEDRLQGSLGGQACHEGNAVFRAAWVGKPARKPPPPTPKPAWLKRLPLGEMWTRVLTNPELRVQALQPLKSWVIFCLITPDTSEAERLFGLMNDVMSDLRGNMAHN